MADDAEHEVPEGAAVLPLIPPELGVHPLLLAALHAVVFFDGSEDTVVDAAAAGEALQYMAAYLQRLRGVELRRVREDMACLAAHARAEKWPKPQVQFLKKFLDEYGIGAGEEG
ncbi:MAG TPA: hypothetical protein VG013_27105 [Gemmataceae bacterium]|jgi:hypothetical protein|nr:hypothetical protein [Gemmataceae bacterium]